jgi:hypothetical protein
LIIIIVIIYIKGRRRRRRRREWCDGTLIFDLEDYTTCMCIFD